MVSFHMFVATQPRRPLDSFSGPTLSPYRPSPNSFPCHTSENSPVSLAIATLPKTPVSNPCVCHTSETPPGVVTLNVPTNVQLSMRNANLPIGVALLNFHLLPAYPLSFHILAHSFAFTKNSTP